MEGMDSEKQPIRQGNWLVKVDLKEAYHAVPAKLSINPFYASVGEVVIISLLFG